MPIHHPDLHTFTPQLARKKARYLTYFVRCRIVQYGRTSLGTVVIPNHILTEYQ